MPRVLVGTALGTLNATWGGLLGFLGGLELTSCNVFDAECEGSELFLITAPTVLAAGAFSALTVYGMGKVFRGNGNLAITLLGGLAGAGAGALATFSLGYPGALLLPPLAAIGAVVAYEITDSLWEPEPALGPGADSNLQLIPVFSVTPGGGVLGGLTGRF